MPDTTNTPKPKTPRMLRGDEAAVYAEHDAALKRVVAAAVIAPQPVREDAVSYAWLQFLRHQPDRPTAFGWLCTVAIREAWRLHERETREVPYPAHLRPLTDPDPTGLAVDAHQALDALAKLPDRQRRYLTLLISGHTYTEICNATGATRTNVNKHLTRARRHLRSITPTDR